MGRIYTARFDGVAQTAQRDFWEILAPSTAIVVLHSVEIGQVTEIADAQEEMLLLNMVRGEGTVTSGSGGTVPTVAPVDRTDAAFGGTVEANNTTKMAVGTGALVILASWQWNIRVPFEKIWTPETRPIIRPSDRLTISNMTTPTDSITFSSTITFESIG